jgi:hypothetical protein
MTMAAESRIFPGKSVGIAMKLILALWGMGSARFGENL